MIATSPVSATSLTPESIDLLPQLDCRIDRSQTSFCDQHGNFPETDSANGEAIVDIAVENELARGTTLESDIQIRGPRWGILRGGHGSIMPLGCPGGNERFVGNR